ncbi:MAG TPA: LysR family transcriptional regulator [Zeimonas sp.]
MYDLKELAHFAAVVRHGGFTAASRATGIPKSSLSKSVSRLENRLQLKLLERSTRRFRVTDVGREFHAHCVAMLESADAAEAVAAHATGEPGGSVRMSCPQGVLHELVGDVLPGFLLRYPKVNLELHVINRRVDLIEEGIDVAMRARQRIDDERSMIARPLGKTHLALVASPDFLERHPVSRLEDIPRLPTIALQADTRAVEWQFVHVDGGTASIVQQPRLASGDSAPLLEAALHGVGIALLPSHLCRRRLQSGELVDVLPEWSTPADIVHLVFTTRKGLRPSVRALVDHLVVEVGALLADTEAAQRSSSVVGSRR